MFCNAVLLYLLIHGASVMHLHVLIEPKDISTHIYKPILADVPRVASRRELVIFPLSSREMVPLEESDREMADIPVHTREMVAQKESDRELGTRAHM